ncbi:MAG TPA: tetratricopeptide repeat protein [Casimicrobiaceae bacterium]|nr:tetratricopeptide repeat protein [Casimicrobiaceae bacterium]
MPAVALTGRVRRWFYDQVAAWCVLFRRRDVALEYYQRMLTIDPRDTLALASMGFQLVQLGRKREAMAMFDRVLACRPDDAEAHFNRGFLLQDSNDHPAAIEAFRAAIAANPDHDRALYGLALSLISTHRAEEAVAPLERNTELQPMSPYGWYQLARVQHQLGRAGKTQKILDHLATFEPKFARQLERETGLRAATLD